MSSGFVAFDPWKYDNIIWGNSLKNLSFEYSPLIELYIN